MAGSSRTESTSLFYKRAPGRASSRPRHTRGGFSRKPWHIFLAVKPLHLFTLGALAMLLASCAKDTRHAMRISVPEQKMALYDRGVEIARYDVSTSKFGLGDSPGSNATPLGRLEIAKKIGG